MKNVELIQRFENLVKLEKKTTAEILECLKEIDRRKLYLELGHTSLFAYLTKGLGYTPSSAQRRIDAARLMHSIPELKDDLKTGALNLMQVSILSQAVRQSGAEVTESDKKEILALIKDKDLTETQKIICQTLDLEIQATEKQRIQKDESVRVELTFSKEEAELLNRVKDLISHQEPGASLKTVIVTALRQFVRKKDPRTEKRDAKTKVAPNQKSISRARDKSQPKCNREALSIKTKRFVFQRDRCCQWRDPKTKEQCQSTFQNQIDHKQGVWAGGSNEPENLQLLCSVHNALKYKREAGIRPTEM